MSGFMNNKWFARLLALFFALLLFVNANAVSQPGKTTLTMSLTSVVDDAPIKVVYDDSKYYVSGYEVTTTVYLSSANKVLLDLETNEQTRSFKLKADLTEYKEGNYEVPIEVTDLNSAVQATIKDQTIHVQIEKRETRVFDVTPKANDNLLKSGYSLENMTTDPNKVEITSGAGTLDQIDAVIAPIEEDRDLSEDISKRVDLLALDKKGNVLSVIIVPSTVTLSVHIEAPSKTVPLKIHQSGSIVSGIKEFKFTTATENVQIYGSREELVNIDAVDLYIDTSNITEEKEDSFTLQVPNGIKVDPKVVKVKITPVAAEKPATKESKEETKSSK